MAVRTAGPPAGAAARTRTARAVRVLAAAVVTLLGMSVACDTSPDKDGGPTGAPSTGNVRSPFTGEYVPRDRPVLAVKLDNAPGARPHSGLAEADLVHVELVEGGVSRLMAVYSARLPRDAGPVRSARESDLELLRQFGHSPALAYSGIRSALQERLDRAPLLPLPPSKAPDAYFRSDTHAPPHNLYLRPATALRSAEGVSEAREIGFRFGAAPEGGEPEPHRSVRYPAASFGFDWSAGRGRWLVSMDGSPARTPAGTRLAAPTVVVQQVTVRPSRYRDVAGAVTPYIETVGSGEATVLRGGKAYGTTWQRRTASDGTTFTLPDGQRMPFARGQVWIVYEAR